MLLPALLAATVLSAQQLAPLWVDPGDLEARDLVHGVGGASAAPKEGETFRFESKESGGHSTGYYVFGADGRKWKVKTGNEASSEVAVSRLLWAVGYRQPVLYYVKDWRIEGSPKEEHPGPGRFRLVSDHDAKGEWAFDDNPFVGTRELNGLIALNLLVNNWDLAPSNNRVYEVGKEKERWYVVQDVGGSLGKTRWPIGTRNNVDQFEKQRFVALEDGHLAFDYHARHKSLLKALTPQDVIWACRLLGRLSDRQLADAFRGAGYPDDVGGRFVRKIRSKIDEGLALEGKR
jgi:hypothetical protein